MNGLDLFRSPKTAADEIADIVSAQCPPVVPENCDVADYRRTAKRKGAVRQADSPGQRLRSILPAHRSNQKSSRKT